jgi:uncharacterized protein (TIGR02145 family)
VRQTIKIKKRMFSTKKMMVVSTLTFLLVGGIIIFGANYFAKGAAYGWIQATWSGGVLSDQSSCEAVSGTWDAGNSVCVATHTDNQSDWTAYSSKDDNVDTSNDELTLSSGGAEIGDTTAAEFDAGADTNGDATIIHTGDELKLTWTCGTDSVTYSGETYPTVEIGTQCWLAKNLNVGTMVTGVTEQTDTGTIEKYCYSNSTANCTTYGGLYQWDEMMQYSTTEGTQGICPTGWHIPTDAEQHTLDSYYATGTCDPNRSGVWDCNPAGTSLKASPFSGLLAGYRNTDGAFANLGTYAYFWSSSVSSGIAWFRTLRSTNTTVFRNENDQAYGFSVRCLKD